MQYNFLFYETVLRQMHDEKKTSSSFRAVQIIKISNVPVPDIHACIYTTCGVQSVSVCGTKAVDLKMFLFNEASRWYSYWL